MNWDEILAAIKTKIDEAVGDKKGAERKKLMLKELEHLPQEIRQLYHDTGHAGATKTLTVQIEALEKERDELKETLTTVEARVKELEEAPDGETTIVKDLKEKITGYEDQIKKLKADHKTAKAEWETEKQTSSKKTFSDRLLANAKLHFDDAWAELEIIKMADRIYIEEGATKVRQRGEKTPILADTDEALMTAVLEELSGIAPDDRKKSGVDSGGGITNFGTNGNHSTLLEQAAAQGKAALPAVLDPKDSADRLGGL